MISIIIYVLLAILLGVANCFYGKRLFYPLLSLTLFAVSIVISVNHFGANAKAYIIGAIVGIVIAILSKFLLKLQVFLAGACFGALLSTIIVAMSHSKHGVMIVIVSALVIGIISVIFTNAFIKLSTAGIGAQLIALNATFLVMNITKLSKFESKDGFITTISNVSNYIHNDFAHSHGMLIGIITIVLFFIGLIYQARQD